MTQQLTHAGKQSLLCFLEGVEVPCVSAATSMNIDAPATCVVQCIPTSMATKLLPRTSIEVFTVREGKEPEIYFTGEIVGYQYAKTPVSLSIIYQAVDDSSYWDTAYQYFVDYGRGSDWLFQQKSSFMGTGNSMFDSVFREHASVLGGLLRSKPRSYPQLQGLVAGVVSILEAVGGVGGRFKGFNDFFTMAEMRRKILAQVSAAEADETSARIYNYKVFWEWIMRSLGSAGSMVSMRDMIKLLFQYIFHHVCPNPIAKYDPPGEKGSNLVTRVSKVKAHDDAKVHVKAAQDVLSPLLSSLSPTFRDAYNKTTSLYGSWISVFERGRGLAQVESELLTRHKTHQTQCQSAVKEALRRLHVFLAKKGVTASAQGMARAIVGQLQALQATLISRMGRMLQMGDRTIGADHPMFWEDLFILYGPSKREVEQRLTTVTHTTSFTLPQKTTPIPLPSPHLRLKSRIEDILNAISKLGTHLGLRLRTVTDMTQRERLHNQIMRPDLWFAAPPKCNIIFPDEYISFQYNRSFLQEVTRMELTTAMEIVGSNSVTNSRYFAPNVQDITGKYTLSSARSGVRLIMPHEVYVGILPHFQFMSEGNIYAARADQRAALQQEAAQIKEQVAFLNKRAALLKGKAASPEDIQRASLYEQRATRLMGRAKNLDTGGISYIQRAVNYMFFKQRFMSRAMGLQGMFLPRLVLGFPGVVINRPATQFDPEAPNFIGDVAGIQHHVTQEGGSTQVSYQTPRETKGIDDDFLGLDGNILQQVRSGSSRITVIRPPLLQRRIKHLGLMVARGHSAMSPTPADLKRAEAAKRELLEIRKQLDFIREFERRMDAKQSYLNMRGPTGGPVVKVEHQGSRKAVADTIRSSQKQKTAEQRAKGSGATSAASKAAGAVQPSEAVLSREQLDEWSQSETWLPPDLRYRDVYRVTERWVPLLKKISMPIEEQLYPTWLSPVYRNEKIGNPSIRGRKGPYQQFFGCGALTDDAGDNPASRQRADDDLKKKDRELYGDYKPAKSIEEAVEELAKAYDSLRSRGLDIRAFIEDYTHRPVATLEEIMGSQDLVLDQSGRVVHGTLGFRSLAWGEYNNLEGLEGASAKLRGASKQQKLVAAGLDVRKARRERVMRYREELDRGQGLRGA